MKRVKAGLRDHVQDFQFPLAGLHDKIQGLGVLPGPPIMEAIGEIQELLKQRFSDWTRVDYDQFLDANVKYGCHDLDRIRTSVDSKAPERVEQYRKVFWQRFTELDDHGEVRAMRYLCHVADLASNLTSGRPVSCVTDRTCGPWLRIGDEAS